MPTDNDLHSRLKSEDLNPTIDWNLPNTKSKCTWSLDKKSPESPHSRQSYASQNCNKILPNVLSFVGNTPLIRLNKIGKEEGIKCELLVKCEYFSAGGSIKDRIALRMIEDAERDGKLKPNFTIIEPTSGNTGIGLALAAAVKGYRCIIVMPDKMSQEKVDTLRALGAEIVRTPTGAHFNNPESHICVARKLNVEIPNSIILDQYRNASNPLVHYDITAEEILHQCDGKVDMIVMGAGTGGTVSGIGRKFKEQCPTCKIVATDPVGSILALPAEMNENGTSFYELEGVGSDFLPTVLDRSVIDQWIKTPDKESLITARRLIKEEGIMCGESSGASVWAALQVAKSLNENQRCVIILPDGLRNYMSRHLNDKWMAERDFFDMNKLLAEQHWWWNVLVSQLPLVAPVTIHPSLSCQKAIEIMDKEGFKQLPVVTDSGSVLGMVSEGSLISNLIAQKIDRASPVENVLYRQFRKVHLNTNLGKVSRILDSDHFVLVVHKQKQYASDDLETTIDKEVVVGIVTRIDLLNYVSKQLPLQPF